MCKPSLASLKIMQMALAIEWHTSEPSHGRCRRCRSRLEHQDRLCKQSVCWLVSLGSAAFPLFRCLAWINQCPAIYNEEVSRGIASCGRHAEHGNCYVKKTSACFKSDQFKHCRLASANSFSVSWYKTLSSRASVRIVRLNVHRSKYNWGVWSKCSLGFDIPASDIVV